MQSIIITKPFIFIFGQDLVYWSGMLAAIVMILLLVSAIYKQINTKFFVKNRPFMTKYHKWLGWILTILIVIHLILAIIQFNFHIIL